MAIALSKKGQVTLRICKDADGNRIRAMPVTLFEDWAVKACVDSVLAAAAEAEGHMHSFVRNNKVFNAPLKPEAGLEDLDINYSTFRPYVVAKEYIGTTEGFNKILMRLVNLANSEAMKDRYLVINVDQNIYARAVKVSTCVFALLCVLSISSLRI